MGQAELAVVEAGLGQKFGGVAPIISGAISGSSCGVAPAPLCSSSRSEGVAPKQPVYIYPAAEEAASFSAQPAATEEASSGEPGSDDESAAEHERVVDAIYPLIHETSFANHLDMLYDFLWLASQRNEQVSWSTLQVVADRYMGDALSQWRELGAVGWSEEDECMLWIHRLDSLDDTNYVGSAAHPSPHLP